MCCLADFLVKVVLFIANFACSLAGITLIALGAVLLVQIREILELAPINLNLIPISIIVIGCIIFLIAFFGCCGAVWESRCLLMTYSVCMLILAAIKIGMTVFLFQTLNNIYSTIEGWIQDAFDNPNMREPFHLVEAAFRCCGVTGPGSYEGVYSVIPPTCCSNPTFGGGSIGTCAAEDAFGGCASIVGRWFEVFGDAIGGVLITFIIIELVAMSLGLFLYFRISYKNRKVDIDQEMVQVEPHVSDLPEK